MAPGLALFFLSSAPAIASRKSAKPRALTRMPVANTSACSASESGCSWRAARWASLVLPGGERVELGEQGLAVLELGRVVDDRAELLAERLGVVDRRGHLAHVVAIGLDLAVVLAAPQPPGEEEDDDEEDGEDDDEPLDAGAASARRGGVVAEKWGEARRSRRRRRSPRSEPPPGSRWWARRDLNPHARKCTRP